MHCAQRVWPHISQRAETSQTPHEAQVLGAFAIAWVNEPGAAKPPPGAALPLGSTQLGAAKPQPYNVAASLLAFIR